MYYLSILLILTGLMNVKEVAAQPFEPTWESLKQYKVPEWFKDAKFGIYFHWGGIRSQLLVRNGTRAICIFQI